MTGEPMHSTSKACQYINYRLKSKGITLCCQLCSTYYTALHIGRLSFISTCNWHNYKDMIAIFKSHKISYVKMRSAYKGSTQSDSIGFLFGCDSGYVFSTLMANNKNLAKAIAYLTQSVKSMQDELMTLKKRGPTQSGINDPLTSSGSQYSDIIGNDNPPPSQQEAQGK